MKTRLLVMLAGLVGLSTTISPTAAASTAAASSPATAPGETIIILDASGSMRERIRGETKMALAQRAVRELIASLPDGIRIGLVAYSHRRNSCDDIELLIPPGPLDRAAFIRAVESLKPNGRTPLSAALEFAAGAVDHTKQRASIILVSDGLETCGGDPCTTAASLAASGAGATIHAVAFDLAAREAKAFACIAEVSNGRFLQANDAATLRDALVVAVAEATQPVKAEPPSEDLRPATLETPAEVPAGAEFPVTWNGPDNPGDFIAIVPHEAPETSFQSARYTREGSPLTLTALMQTGRAEVRYIAGRSQKILGRAELTITPVEASLEAPDEAVAGAVIPIAWTGPNNANDFITIVPRGAPDGAWPTTAYTRTGSPVQLATPVQPGEAEIRYISGQGHQVLARRVVRLTAPTITLDAPAEVVAGASIAVTWSGPDNPNDFLVVTPKDAPDGAWSQTVYTRTGSPAKLTAPIEAGDGEIRYLSGQGYKVLARRPIRILATEVTLKAPDEVIAGALVPVVWTGPDNANDFLVIAPQSAPDGAWSHTVYTRTGSPAKLTAPIEAGDAEIRYLTGQGYKVRARRPIRVVSAEVTLDAPAEAIAGSPVEVTWTGPNNANDFLTLVPRDAPDGSWQRSAYTRTGSPLKLLAPSTPGDCEIRYLSGQGNKVLARRPITIRAATITLEAPPRIAGGSTVLVNWTGPNNAGDFITIVAKDAKDGAFGKYAYTRQGSPARIEAPATPGPAEIRYLNGYDNKVLARARIEVTAP